MTWECKKCEMTFVNKANYERHLKSKKHNETFVFKTYECALCNFSTKFKNDYRRHCQSEKHQIEMDKNSIVGKIKHLKKDCKKIKQSLLELDQEYDRCDEILVPKGKLVCKPRSHDAALEYYTGRKLKAYLFCHNYNENFEILDGELGAAEGELGYIGYYMDLLLKHLRCQYFKSAIANWKTNSSSSRF